MAVLKFKVLNQDRVGLLQDISAVLTQNDINVNNLEVVPNSMFFEVEREGVVARGLLFKEIEAVVGVGKCVEIELLPWEGVTQRLQAVLDSVSEGVLSIDWEERITTVNPVAEAIFGMKRDELIGEKISKILPADLPMLHCLANGQAYSHQEICINKGRRKYHYVTSGRPIKDKHQRVVGVVATIKDMTEVRRLVYSMTKPTMVTFEDIVGDSDKLQCVIQMGERVAEGSSTVLLRGESGTGKELFARSVHMASPRREQPFVPVNCAALPDSLLESELFGYTDGAFTGSRKNGKQGLFEFAGGGTIFLDEIAEISPHLQAKLLRVLQEGKVRRVGGQEETAIDVRVIAATNKNLEEMVEKNEFRKDLYYRLNVIPLFLPALRERMEDIAPLVNHFLAKMNIRFGKNVEFVSKEALEKLYHHDWPGNVRELENVVERAANLVAGKWLTADVIMIDPGVGRMDKEGYEGQSLAEIMDQVEKQVVSRTIQKTGSIRKAASQLGVSHTTVLNKIKKYNIPHGKNS
ncbi:sigma 54-interacting transcriptional regulator [Metallumcola ferriviriculae]|uniref:HTH-type transcriptional regulatory protein TyrR n=1 Tax=Metallumcola ferriviriculae TaxID=3039180 RepID=A0AAU0UKN5_9FIRM|nr:sigma 54-interacting transcriptional regulator [Desulfitibacteraceae bacterium MK1]